MRNKKCQNGQNVDLILPQTTAEDTLHRYTALFDFAPVAYFILDEHGLIRQANLNGAALLECERSWLYGKKFQWFVAQDDLPHIGAFLIGLSDTRKNRACEIRVVKRDQGSRHVHIEAVEFPGLPGEEKEYLVAITDVTAQHEGKVASQVASNELEQRVKERTAELLQSNTLLEQEINFESLLADLSARFVNMPAETVDDEIVAAQGRVCEFLGVDLSCLCQHMTEPADVYRLSHYYRPLPGPTPPQPMYYHEYFPWTQQQLLANRVVNYSSLDEMPPEAATDLANYRYYSIKSILSIPLSIDGQIIGFLGFKTMQQERTWPQELVQRLQLVGQVFANALARKQANTRLRESQERLKLATDSARVGLWSADLNSQRVWVTPHMQEIFQSTSDEVLTFDSILKMLHPEDLEAVEQEARRAVAADVPIEIECRVVQPDGTVRWVVTRGQPHYSPSGKPDRLMGASVDITERKRTEEKIRESDELNRTVLDSLLDYVAILDDKGKIIAVNKAWEMFAAENGYPAPLIGAAVGVNYLDLCHGTASSDETAAHVLTGIRSVLEGSLEFFQFEYPCDSPSEQQWFLIRTMPLKRAEGGIVVSHNNITRRKSAEQEAMQHRTELAHLVRVSAMNQLSVSLAHELRQPLASILVNAAAAGHLLTAKPMKVGELRTILKDIVEQGHRAGDIIREMRFMMKKGETQMKPGDINAKINNVLVLLRSDLQPRKVSVVLQLSPYVPPVLGDRTQLQQVLLNLITNACDAMDANPPDERRLIIKTSYEGGELVEVSVVDRGSGILPESIESIFGPFQSTKADGLGLGLYICRSIIMAHGGQLWATNNADGGSTFHFTLVVAGSPDKAELPQSMAVTK